MLGQILVTKQTGAQGKVVSKGRTLGANIGGWEQNQWKTHLRERTRAKISSQRESKLNNCHLWLTVVPALPFSPYQQACSSNIVDRLLKRVETQHQVSYICTSIHIGIRKYYRNKHKLNLNIDQWKAYYEAAGGEKKRRVYGLGSQAKCYYGPNLHGSSGSDTSSSIPSSSAQSASNLNELVTRLIPALTEHIKSCAI
ncbi:PREDICTED: uncharacterized protein LOC109216840 isoform X2 [Nicotiana attenuata]|uniref:uncharacterized protein LOC109216840 isoform X2 n=1 Tax=Nicotiana attenuata TaxID=49451 RepID=UPI000904D0D8|nr:PREDICTED: uncharacterized protein LOC109216840 isoform X2 [Nicotiana attenuata]